MSQYKLDIDGSGAKTGADVIVQSFERIKNASYAMERNVRSAFDSMSTSFNKLRGIKGISPQVVDSLREFSRIMGSYKGPSQASVANTSAMITALRGAVGLRVSSAGVSTLLGHLAGYKGPSQASAKNTRSLLNALSNFSGGPKISAGFSNFIRVLGSFTGPSARAAANTRAFLGAVSSFTPPTGLGKTTKDFVALANAIALAESKLQSLRGNKTVTINVGGAKGGARQIQDLARSYGFLETAILRTQTAMNALGGVLAIKSIINASNAVIKIQNQLEAATGTVQQARVQFQFLREETDRLGLNFVETAKSYGFFLGAIQGTNVTFAEAQKIFLGFATAGRALQLSADDVEGVFRALGQIMSKGKLQAEELRGQLGDRLPGAFVRFARALDMTKPGQLDDALKRGAISGDKLKNAIIKVAEGLENDFAGAAEKASKTVDAAFQRLKNAFTFGAADFGKNGLNESIINLTDSLTKLLQSGAVSNFLKVLGGAFKLLGNNIELVASALTAVATVSLARFIFASTAATGAVKLFQTALQAGKLIAMAAATQNFTRALTVLGIVARANWPLLLISGLTALYFWYAKNTSAQEEMAREVQKAGDNSAYAKNLIDDYVAKINDSSVALDKNSQKLRENTILAIQNAMAKAQEVDLGASSSGGGYSTTSYLGGLVKLKRPGRAGFSDPLAKQLAASVEKSRQPGTLAGVNTKEDLIKRAESLQQIGAYIQNNEGSPDAEKLKSYRTALSAQIESFQRLGELGIKYNGFNPAEVLKSRFGDVNRDTPPWKGISGDVEKKTKNPPGATAFSNSVQSALDAMDDLKVRANATLKAVEAMSRGGVDTIGAKARAAAAEQVENFEQAFKGVNLKKREEGIIAIARSFDLTASSAAEAKTKLTDLFASEQEKVLRADVARQAQEKTLELRDQNDLLAKQAETIGKSQAEQDLMNASLQAQSELLVATEEQRAKILPGLEAEYRRRVQINQVIAAGNQLFEDRRNSELNSQIGGLYGLGLNPREMEDTISFLRRKAEIEQQYGRGNPLGELQIANARDMIQQARALQQLEDQFNKTQQAAQDLTDTIVDGFRDAMMGTKSFGDAFNEIFRTIKRTILDLVIFNPLRSFLQDAIGGALSAGQNPGAYQAALAITNNNISDRADRGNILSFLQSSPGLVGSGALDTPFSLSGATRSNSSLLTPAVKQMIGYQASQTGQSVGDQIVVTAPEVAKAQAPQIVRNQVSALTPLKRMFDYKKNGANISDGFKEIKGVFKGETKGLGNSIKGLASGLGKMVGAAAQAYGAYTLGKGLAKSLGLGRVGQGIAGGAAAGYSLAGPIGAAVGAVIGGVAGFLKKPPKGSANITVGANGRAVVSGVRGNKSAYKDAAKALANQGISVFDDFANQFDSFLKEGNYGTFGVYGKKKKQFYSLTGQLSRKGKPVGREGVDYIYGDESTLAAFALKSQINAGRFGNLDPIYQTIARNSTAANTEQLYADFQVGKSYLAFIDQARSMSDLQRQVRDLNKTYDSLSRSAKQLGLNENLLLKARDKVLSRMKDDFNFEVNQELLGFTDPLKQAYNALLKDYEATVANAIAVGGDLANVELLYGKKREEILKNSQEQINDGLNKAAGDMLTQLTASGSSPLSAGRAFGSASQNFRGLVSEIRGGNFKNADQLQTLAQNYLDTGRNLFGSSSGYFDVFNEVTAFLKEAQSLGVGGTPAGDLPALPAIQEIVDKINKANDDLKETTQEVGAAIVEGNVTQEQKLEQIRQELANFNGNIGNLLGAIWGGSVGSIGPGTNMRYPEVRLF